MKNARCDIADALHRITPSFHNAMEGTTGDVTRYVNQFFRHIACTLQRGDNCVTHGIGDATSHNARPFGDRNNGIFCRIRNIAKIFPIDTSSLLNFHHYGRAAHETQACYTDENKGAAWKLRKFVPDKFLILVVIRPLKQRGLARWPGRPGLRPVRAVDSP